MPALHTCPGCRGFIPDAAPECPNCGRSLSIVERSRTRALLAAASAGIAMMACSCKYGAMALPSCASDFCTTSDDIADVCRQADGGLEHCCGDAGIVTNTECPEPDAGSDAGP